MCYENKRPSVGGMKAPQPEFTKEDMNRYANGVIHKYSGSRGAIQMYFDYEMSFRSVIATKGELTHSRLFPCLTKDVDSLKTLMTSALADTGFVGVEVSASANKQFSEVSVLRVQATHPITLVHDGEGNEEESD